MELVSVKVFTGDGSGSVGSLLAGLDFVLRAKILNPDQPAVANLSLGTTAKLQSLHAAVAALVAAGVTMIVSAGNEAGNACDKYPAAWDEVLTVAATTYDDRVAPYTNLGPCTDLLAPGDAITSAWRNSNYDRATLSGTSAAAAHAAGVAALVLELFPKMSPQEMKGNLQKFAELQAIDGIPGDSQTVNLLLNMGSLALA